MKIGELTPKPVLDIYEFVSRKGLLSLGLNIDGLIDNNKNVSVWFDDKEVLTGNFLDKSLNVNQIGPFNSKSASSTLGLNAVIIDLDVSETSKIMEHPIESGVVIADHKVINPVELTLRLTMPVYEYEPILRELREYWTQSTKLTVQSKAYTYTNMVICDIPHSETPRNVSRLSFNVRMKQALEVFPQYIRLSSKQVKKPKNADTVKSGQKQGTPVKTSILQDILRWYRGFF